MTPPRTFRSNTVTETPTTASPGLHVSGLGYLRTAAALLVLFVGQCVPTSANHLWPILLEKLDLDGDGTVDFELRQGFTYGLGQPPDPNACFRPLGVQGNGLHTLQNNRVLLSTHLDCFGALESIPSGTPIGPDLLPHQSWGRNGDTFNIVPSPFGNETNGPLATATHVIVGVQFDSPRGTHFGWVEISSPAPGETPRIVGFAAEGTPFTPILAGAPPSTPFLKPLIPLRVPPSDFLIGGILIETSTNASNGHITRRVELAAIPEVECLLAPKEPTWPSGSYPATLVERTFLPTPLPSGWSWTKPGENLRLYSSTETIDGALVEHAGPLAEAESILMALRTASGGTWWIEFQRSGDVSFVSASPAGSGPLLVGQPLFHGTPTDVAYIDIDRDGYIDFVDSTTIPTSGDIQHTLHPMRGQKILVPSNVNRFGTQIAMEPPSDSTWSTNSLTVLHTGTSTGSLGNSFTIYRSVGIPSGTNGYIAVQLTSGKNTHIGWIQYNRYEVFLGVVGMSPSVSPGLEYFDHGYARVPGTPVTIGADSSLPFSLQILEAENNLHLRWDPLRRHSSRLEMSTSMHSPTWAPVPAPVADNLLFPKPTSLDPVFFRLQPVEPKPPVILP